MAFRELTGAEIEAFASRPNVRRIAVENFLGSLGNEFSMGNAMMNLNQDATSYKWNGATMSAIRAGIKKAWGR
jgi:hypothetical protein